jgi:uncharacterized protein (TIGR03067 family)
MRMVAVLAAVCLLVGADDSQDAAKKDLAKMQGEWSMVSGERDGQPLGTEIVENTKRVAKGDEVTILVNGDVYFKAKVTLDPGKKPKAIDYTMTEGENKDKKQLAIYEMNGDSIKICSAAPGTERPTDFTAKEGSNRTLSVWKRDKK